MHRESKRGDIKTVLWIVIVIIVFLVLVVMVGKSGGFSRQIVANIGEKLNPFG